MNKSSDFSPSLLLMSFILNIVVIIVLDIVTIPTGIIYSTLTNSVDKKGRLTTTNSTQDTSAIME
ncbi:MAG: hypothetical protein KDD03_03955 [Gelidibacter sp.]|nr:hypothetical protein [Gelidibacter sp.]